ncbi:MAG: hypothetical protein C4527_24800 [Candidatus Omnitrophota bacterium]|jgi:hypothetical protein|nr:MAG: hypothetical protein C4527_24800 [Candidatus Omnitrophota bacterium]
MYNAFDVIQRNGAQIQVNTGVGSTTKYEGKENAPMPYFRRAMKKQEEEEKKEKKKRQSEGRIDFVA